MQNALVINSFPVTESSGQEGEEDSRRDTSNVSSYIIGNHGGLFNFQKLCNPSHRQAHHSANYFDGMKE